MNKDELILLDKVLSTATISGGEARTFISMTEKLFKAFYENEKEDNEE